MLKPKNTVLVLIDVQEKLLSAIHDNQRLVDTLTRLVRGMDVLGVPVLVTEQYPEGLGTTVPPLQDVLGETKPIEKTTFSCYRCKKFIKKLDDISPKQVLLAGIETHVCVYQTAAEMADAGYDVQVVADAVASRTEQNHQLGLQRISQCSAMLTGLEMALMELLRDASDKRFKDILSIIK